MKWHEEQRGLMTVAIRSDGYAILTVESAALLGDDHEVEFESIDILIDDLVKVRDHWLESRKDET